MNIKPINGRILQFFPIKVEIKFVIKAGVNEKEHNHSLPAGVQSETK